MNSINYKIVVLNNNNDLKEKYQQKKVEMAENNMEDAGMDLFIPDTITIPGNTKGMLVGLDIKANAFVNTEQKSSYMLFPRSSMGSKTPLRLANSIGLVDRHYTGELKMCIDNLSCEDYVIKKYDRLVQLVGPTHELPCFELVDELEDTVRGAGGYGSTGR